MDSFVCSVGHAYQVFGINNVWIKVDQIMHYDRVHVMDNNEVSKRITISAHIEAIIPNENVIADRSPDFRLVERLIKIAIETERRFANSAV